MARTGPATKASGESTKEILHRHARDREWEKELREVRGVVAVEDRRRPDPGYGAAWSARQSSGAKAGMVAFPSALWNGAA